MERKQDYTPESRAEAVKLVLIQCCNPPHILRGLQ